MTKSILVGADRSRLISLISFLRFGVRRASKSHKPILSLKAIAKVLSITPTTVRRYLIPTLQRTGANSIGAIGRPHKLRSNHVKFIISEETLDQ